MAFYRFDDPTFWEAVTPEAMRWTQAAARGAGMEIGSILLGDDDDLSAPMVSILQLPPGGVLPRHAHHCHRVEVILFGSIETEADGTLGPGDTMISPPGEYYGPHIAGSDGAVTVEIFSEAGARTDFAPVDDPGMAAAIANADSEFRRAQGRP